jgi:hypothetical protein
MEDDRSLTSVSDDELLRRLSELLRQSRRVEADLVAHIGEVDARRLFAREAVPSMFAYCTQVLHLSEFEAYLRLTVARAARRHPMVLAMLRDGSLHLSAVAKLAPHLTPESGETLLGRAAHRSKREVEELIAELAPRPDAPTVVRKLPDRGAAVSPVPTPRNRSHPAGPLGGELGPDRVELPALKPASDSRAADRAAGIADSEPIVEVARAAAPSVPSAPDRARPQVVEALSPARYRIQFTASAELRDKLERLQALLRLSGADVDLAAVIDMAVTEKLLRLEAQRFARVKAPRKSLSKSDTSPSSRHLPAAVKRAVHERDDGRCRYVDAQGRRCTAREGLEFHHRHPFGYGGDHSPANIVLMCRSHNGYLAEIDYGRHLIETHRRPGSEAQGRRPFTPSLSEAPSGLE